MTKPIPITEPVVIQNHLKGALVDIGNLASHAHCKTFSTQGEEQMLWRHRMWVLGQAHGVLLCWPDNEEPPKRSES